MPNLIHSLDASSIIMFFFNLIKMYPNNHKFFSIKDCFATSADKIDTHMLQFKSVYTDIYYKNLYIKEFDTYIFCTWKRFFF